MAGSVLKLGWTNPLTDAFGAHPVLGAVLDLNDGVTFSLDETDGLELEAPSRTLIIAGNIRTQGERAARGIYRHNRRLVARVILGPMASYADLVANVRALVTWMSAPPAQPVMLQYQPAGASAPVYLDVVGAAHDIPADEGAWLRLQLEPLELVFLVRPGLRGDRVTLSNLVANPGFEAPCGPGVVVFNDPLANADAYSVQVGSAPSVAASVLTIPSGTRVAFGSPGWGAINSWQVRFQMLASSAPDFYVHFTDANNYLDCFVTVSSITLRHVVAGSSHTLATASIALTAGNWYWLQVTQFPTVPGDPADVQVTLYTDSAGAIGTPVSGGALGPVAMFDAVTALTGRPQISASGASLPIGGAFAGVHTVALFGPGAWLLGSTGTGTVSGAWEQNAVNTYGGGPVASSGAARIDCPPAGTVNASWAPYSGGAPAGSPAIPVSAAGNVLGLVAYARSSGLGANAQILLQLYEYDASGAFLRTTTAQTLTGNQASWTRLSGAVTTGRAARMRACTSR